jgi:putative addiction module CopG family antidote
MEVSLTPEQQAVVQMAVRSGRYRSAEDAIRDAIARWEEDDRSRVETITAVDEGLADLEAGHFSDYTDSTLSELAAELKAEGRAFRATRGPTSA